MRRHHLSTPSLVTLALTLIVTSSCTEPPVEPEAPAAPPVAAVLTTTVPAEAGLVWTLGWDGEPADTHRIGRFTALRGWTRAEQAGRWTVGRLSGFAVDAPRAGRWRLEVDGRVNLPDAEGASQRVEVTVDRRRVDDLVFTTEPSTAGASAELRRGRNVIVLRIENVASPHELGLSDDRRVLGIQISAVRLIPEATEPDGRVAPVASDPVVHHVSAEVGAVELDPDTVLAAPVRLPEDGRLTMFVEPVDSAGGLPETVDLRVQPLGGGRPRTLPRRILPRDGGGGTVTLRLPELAGRVVVVTLDADAPVALAVNELATPGWSAPTTVEPWPTAPDVVVLVLDAMRGDALGATRQGRALTPRLDDLGRRSHVFANAFAPTPYTVASLATVHTGLGFHDHGVVTRDRRLADEATTLAEALAGAGYRTVAVSATPNDSPALGFDQGFETFVAGWTGRSRADRLDPFHVTRLAEEQLASAPDDRPLFLFVHYIHPHEPYAPPERFDVFTDPAYSGSMTGRHRTFDQILRGQLVADARDREHLENLYAGNVLAVDAAVGELLDRLAARDRWRDTVVVVTSDHGDEFFERGLAGHNRTVYDELLRVPMVVRVPDARASGGQVHSRLVTLQDIAPTMARIAGGSMTWPLGAVDLLEPPDDPAVRHDRWMLSRTADPALPIHGVRTLGFSAVLYPWGDGELYALANDPDEIVDLRARRPDLFAGLSVLARRELWREPFIPAAGDAGPRTEEELEMLRALGYVD